MKFKRLLLPSAFLIGGALWWGSTFLGPNHLAKVTYHLVTDDGQVLKDFPYQANVLNPKFTIPSKETIQLKKNTDQNGYVTFTLPYYFDGVCSGIPYNTPGYYFSNHRFFPTNLVSGKWQPWNPTIEVVVKPIINPIPMYAQEARLDFPTNTTSAGFDLEAGDWVNPYGKGKTPDFVFTIKEKIPFVKASLPYDFYTTISFSNKGDGIQNVLVSPTNSSVLRMPRYAPDSGYQADLVQHIYYADNKTSDGEIGKDQNYFFRVRSILDAQGNVKSALYGKIVGPVECGARGYTKFTYYLNPTPNDRNMEFDPKRNLFRNLSPFQSNLAP
jgi:hypothetical protein